MQNGIPVGDGVRADHREFHLVQEFQKVLRAVVEFVIADGHDIKPRHIHQFGRSGTFVMRIE